MKRLIVCADGTWNTPDRRDGASFAPSNVVKIARAILPQDAAGTPQVVYYDQGIGTDNLVDKLTGGAFGVGLSRNVRDAYLFLVHNYEAGDEIYFYGFSRGAFTVRSTGGLIRKAGLVQKRHADRAYEAWDLYRKRDDSPDTSLAQKFRDSYSRYPIRIRLIGVWDTVGALGIPGMLNFVGRNRFQFHDVALSRSVDFAFQALAIDERRRFFQPTLWEQHPEAVDQVLEQVWFPGVHMDVGGGYQDTSLADAAFVWMVQRSRLAGIAFDDDYVNAAKPEALGAIHESRMFPYTLIPIFERPLGAGVSRTRSIYEQASRSNESLDDSARRRFNGIETYRPANLDAYLKSEMPG
jgi:uncharacterized protein (DUF2235 family)